MKIEVICDVSLLLHGIINDPKKNVRTIKLLFIKLILYENFNTQWIIHLNWTKNGAKQKKQTSRWAYDNEQFPIFGWTPIFN